MKVDRLYIQGKKLREQGLSYREIHERLGIAKSTAQAWYKSILLSKDARQRLLEIGDRGRASGWRAMAAKRFNRKQEISAQAEQDIKKIKYTPELMRLIVSILYWGEGAKNSGEVRLSNSDPQMVKLFLYLVNASFSLNPTLWRATLHLHEYHDIPRQKAFWSNVTGIDQSKISIYMKPHTGISKKFGYPGCIHIRYGSMDLLRYIQAMYNALAKHSGA